MKKEKNKDFYKIFVYICLVLFAIMIIVPVVWVFLASIKENSEFYGNPWSLPKGVHFQNFIDAWNAANMGDYMLNSIEVTAMALILLLVISIPYAYILARHDFKGKKVLNTILKAGLFVNLSYIVIPIFMMLLDGDKFINKYLNLNTSILLNNKLILALIYASTSIPFTVYLLSNYFKTISKTYEEAAYIDGAGYFRTMVDVILPMAKPSVITVILFNFLSFWNEYILSMTIMTDQASRTLPVGLINLQQAARGAANYGRLYAGLVIVMLPTLILYILVQKQLTEGMMVGGDKG